MWLKYLLLLWTTVLFYCDHMDKVQIWCSAGWGQIFLSSSSASYPSGLQLERFCSNIDRDGLWHRSVPLFWGWATRDSPQQTSDQDSLLLNCSLSTGVILSFLTLQPLQFAPLVHTMVKLPLKTPPGLIRRLKPLYHNKGNCNTSKIRNLLHHLLLIPVNSPNITGNNNKHIDYCYYHWCNVGGAFSKLRLCDMHVCGCKNWVRGFSILKMT